MKKKTILALAAAFCLGSSMTAFAAPEIMPDGGVFDPVYYAQNNPDVVAAGGTDASMLYLHYTLFGQTEGRLPFDPDAETESETDSTEGITIDGVQGVFGEKYVLPTWCEYDVNWTESVEEADGMRTMTVQTTVDEGLSSAESVVQYTVPGYVWKPIQIIIEGEMTESNALWWPLYNYRYMAENSSDWEWVDGTYRFKVTQDGVEYPECRALWAGGYQWSEAGTLENYYFLVPENYAGKVGFAVRGVNSADSSFDVNVENAVTYIF